MRLITSAKNYRSLIGQNCIKKCSQKEKNFPRRNLTGPKNLRRKYQPAKIQAMKFEVAKLTAAKISCAKCNAAKMPCGEISDGGISGGEI